MAITNVPVDQSYVVLPQVIYDWLIAGTDDLDTNVTKWLGTACSTPTVAGVPEVDILNIFGTILSAATSAQLSEGFSKFFNVSSPTGTVNSLPGAAPDAIGGLPISDAGGLDLDTHLGYLTGSVALASVLGALDDVAAAGDPTDTDTIMKYAKQVINVLVGSDGVGTFPSEAAPANGVSLAEVIRAMATDLSTTIPGTISTAQTDLDTITGSDGATLATAQGLYAPAKAGAEMALTSAAEASIVDAHLDELTADHIGAGSVGAELGAAYDVICGALAAIGDTTDTGATPTLAQAIAVLYAFKKNNVQTTNTSRALRNAADDANIMSATMSDDGTTFKQGHLS